MNSLFNAVYGRGNECRQFPLPTSVVNFVCCHFFCKEYLYNYIVMLYLYCHMYLRFYYKMTVDLPTGTCLARGYNGSASGEGR